VAKSVKKKIVVVKCEGCFHDTQIFERGTDKLTFNAIYRYAEFKIAFDQIPKPDKEGRILNIDVGDDCSFADYKTTNWKIEIKDLQLKKKIKSIIDSGADIGELTELGFENSDGHYDIITDDGGSFIVEDSSTGPSIVEKIGLLKSRGKYLLETEVIENIEESIVIFTQASDLQKKLDSESDELLFINTLLGKAYGLIGNTTKALEVFECVKQKYILLDGMYSSGASYVNSLIGDMFVTSKNYEDAIFYLEKSLLFDSYDVRIFEFANVLLKAGRKTDALGVLKVAKQKVDFDDYEKESRILIEIFNILIGDESKRKEALSVLEEANTSASLSRNDELIKECKGMMKKI